jgi:hypothetical protein
MAPLIFLSVLAMTGGEPESEKGSPEVVALVDVGTPGMGIFGTRLEGVFCTGPWFGNGSCSPPRTA